MAGMAADMSQGRFLFRGQGGESPGWTLAPGKAGAFAALQEESLAGVPAVVLTSETAGELLPRLFNETAGALPRLFLYGHPVDTAHSRTG